MDYFTDVLATFLERVSCIAVYAGPESSWISSKMKMNEGLMGLERHEGEQLIK